MIPRIFHQIWLGSDPIPNIMQCWQARWISLHPEWSFKIWVGEGITPLSLQSGNEVETSAFPELMMNACHVRQQSNIWRLELLLKQGGVYLDTDIEPIKNIEPLLKNGSAYASPLWAIPKLMNNAFIAAESGHPWIEACVAGLSQLNPAEHLSMGTKHITAMLEGRQDVCILGKNDIYQNSAWPMLKKFRRPDPRWYAIHHFASCNERLEG